MEGPSVTNSISAALEHLQRILFQPFRLKFWLRLGAIIFFISTGGQSSLNFGKDIGGSNPNSSAYSDFGFVEPFIDSIKNFHEQNQLLFIMLMLIFVAVILILWLVFSYFSSVGRFMFVEALLQEDIRLRESFANNKTNGFQFWIWSILLSIGSVIFISMLGGSIFISTLLLDNFKTTAIILIIITSFLTLLGIVCLFTFWIFTNRFVPPIMYLENIGFGEAWRLLASYLQKYWAKSALFILMLGVLTTVISVIAVIILLLSFIPTLPIIAIIIGLSYIVGNILMGLTWNITTIVIATIGGIILFVIFRYVWAVLFSPLEVFLQSYALAFLDGFNPKWNIDLVPNPKNDYNEINIEQ